MDPTAPTLDQLVATMSEAFPKLDEDEERLAVNVYRSLAEGRPVSGRALAERSGLPAEQVARALATWPGVFRDEAQSVIGFWGLALPEMSHGTGSADAGFTPGAPGTRSLSPPSSIRSPRSIHAAL